MENLNILLQQLLELKSKYKIVFNDKLTEKDIIKFEKEHNIILPESYRLFLLEVGNGGAEVFELPINRAPNDISEPSIIYPGITEDEWDDLIDPIFDKLDNDIPCKNIYRGMVTLQYLGCLDYVSVIVSGEHKDRVVYWNLDNPCPIVDESNNFLEWFLKPLPHAFKSFTNGWQIDWFHYIDSNVIIEYNGQIENYRILGFEYFNGSNSIMENIETKSRIVVNIKRSFDYSYNYHNLPEYNKLISSKIFKMNISGRIQEYKIIGIVFEELFDKEFLLQSIDSPYKWLKVDNVVMSEKLINDEEFINIARKYWILDWYELFGKNIVLINLKDQYARYELVIKGFIKIFSNADILLEAENNSTSSMHWYIRPVNISPKSHLNHIHKIQIKDEILEVKIVGESGTDWLFQNIENDKYFYFGNAKNIL